MGVADLNNWSLLMESLRNQVEQGFEKFAYFIYRHRIKTVIITLLLLGAVICQIPKITIDTSTEGFLHDNDPTLLAYNAFRDQFGRDEVVIIAIQSPSIFSQDFLKKLKLLHEDLEQNVPHIDDITSLVNVRNTRGEADELIVEDLLENWPQNETEMAKLKSRVASNQLYKNLLVSEDGQFTSIVIKTQSHSSLGLDTDIFEGFEDEPIANARTDDPVLSKIPYLTDEENSQVVAAVKDTLRKYRTPDFIVYLTGSPVVTHFLKQALMKINRRTIPSPTTVI
jgi:predicted RND superfamily exporter protein